MDRGGDSRDGTSRGAMLNQRGGISPVGMLKALRPFQWSKNLLILFPVLAAHRSWDAVLAVSLGLGFVAFSFVASIVYLVNDLVDLEHDRAHPRKRLRPLASGSVSIRQAATMMLVLALLAVAIARALPDEFTIILVVYVCLNIVYSLMFKRLVMLDVISLVGFYVLRLLAGAVLAGIALTGWFLAFCAFILLSIAFAKRVGELQFVADSAAASGRGYRQGDLDTLRGFGMICSVAGILVYCLYITGDDVRTLYARGSLLWAGLPLLLYWKARLWILVGRGELLDDPVEFMVRDPATYLVGLGMLGVVWAAAAGWGA